VGLEALSDRDDELFSLTSDMSALKPEDLRAKALTIRRQIVAPHRTAAASRED